MVLPTETNNLKITINYQKEKVYICIMHALDMQKQTSIRISSKLMDTLKKFKEEGESYEEVIWDFIEPHLELSEQTKRDIKQSRKEYERGETSTLEEIKTELGF
jgi:hypothetical protein